DEPLPTVVVGFRVYGNPALPGDHKQVLLDGNVETLRFDAGGEDIDVHPIGCRSNVDRWERAAPHRADAGRRSPAAKELVQLAVESHELVDEVGIETAQYTAEHSEHLL